MAGRPMFDNLRLFPERAAALLLPVSPDAPAQTRLAGLGRDEATVLYAEPGRDRAITPPLNLLYCVWLT